MACSCISSSAPPPDRPPSAGLYRPIRNRLHGVGAGRRRIPEATRRFFAFRCGTSLAASLGRARNALCLASEIPWIFLDLLDHLVARSEPRGLRWHVPVLRPALARRVPRGPPLCLGNAAARAGVDATSRCGTGTDGRGGPRRPSARPRDGGACGVTERRRYDGRDRARKCERGDGNGRLPAADRRPKVGHLQRGACQPCRRWPSCRGGVP